MLILGLESSCDETSAAVVRMGEGKREILSNIVASQIDIHRLYGGVVPEIASRAHIEAISRITYRALDEAGVTLTDIGAIAVTSHPGLIGALIVGVNFAKSLAFARGIPLVEVNHVKAHVAAAYLEYPSLEPPFTAIVVSGGHTSIYEVNSYTDFSVIGETRDDAAGEAFDKVARVLGMPYPGGAEFNRAAKGGDPSAVELPSPALHGDNLDFSFSGIKTAALNYINSLRQKGEEPDVNNLCASYTNTIVKAIVKKCAGALDKSDTRRLVLAGGVAANSYIREGLSELCKKRGAEFFVPSISLCGDNAAMVAAAGYFEYLDGAFADTSLNASANDNI
ncbi:MAG: tRNA (adenosine(37)-N6)-threonylcarbamoyltransferase complex transferase subunit TsaD [Ruminococcaceae bacterium]|nr:tRNA (adenosine(37)-N6)-threonylcarbamoyltransferase complex transferase subunit TsaD [Oscillospiraceae bacterium]